MSVKPLSCVLMLLLAFDGVSVQAKSVVTASDEVSDNGGNLIVGPPDNVPAPVAPPPGTATPVTPHTNENKGGYSSTQHEPLNKTMPATDRFGQQPEENN